LVPFTFSAAISEPDVIVVASAMVQSPGFGVASAVSRGLWGKRHPAGWVALQFGAHSSRNLFVVFSP
jgi:hypothetical protein